MFLCGKSFQFVVLFVSARVFLPGAETEVREQITMQGKEPVTIKETNEIV